ncbi:TIGR03943 family putative permease subunit [Paenibacillus sp. GCM10027626]|uniref:TIGR03943 family putative permease subunit n=1 Tax=Paenibacillus sp. GCM10027626 TaxID=3273411 RepID=UPI003628A8E4
MKVKAATVHYLLRSLVLGSLSFLIVRLVQDGKLQYYIAPRTELYVKLSALVLLGIAACMLFIAVQNQFPEQNECGCNHHTAPSWGKSAIMYSMFILPLVLGFFTSDAILGSNITALKGINLSTSGSTASTVKTAPAFREAAPLDPEPEEEKSFQENEAASDNTDSASEPDVVPEPDTAPEADADPDPLAKLFPYDEFSNMHANLGRKLYGQDKIVMEERGFMEVLTALDLYTENFMGKTIEISGFVYREDDMSAEQFVVSRLAMQCCAADTEPYGMLVKYKEGKNLTNDTWVRVTGKLGTTIYRDREIMELAVDKVEKIASPESPYVYPDYDYFEQMLEE